MKIIVNEKELKEYFDGLSRLLQKLKEEKQPAAMPVSDTSTLLAELRQAIREEMAATEDKAYRPVSPLGLKRLKQVFEPHAGKPVELLTPAGTVEGTITKVNGDFLMVREQGGTSVLVPLEQLVAFQLTGKQVER